MPTEKDRIVNAKSELIRVIMAKFKINLFMCEELVDFILADRKRICEPLVKEWDEPYHTMQELADAINETLKLAGLNESDK